MFEPHALAKVLPAMSGEDYERLRTDIAANGLLEPITLYEGKVLDGINRQKVCDETGVSPQYEEFSGDDPARFVFSQNLARRHLTVGQLGMVGADLMKRFRVKRGRPEKGLNSGQTPGKAAEQVADLLGVSRDTINKAARVKKERPDLGRKVKAGKMTLNAAVEEMTGRHTGGNSPRRAKNWNGKTNPTREREIRANKKNGTNPRPDNYNDLLRLSLDMNRACSIIESYHVEDFDLEATTLDLVDTFHDDLITLAQWVDRAMMATQAWLTDVNVRRKIDTLRNTIGRTPEETESFRRVADKLERKLEAVLPSGV
jgi:hypothetical protein